MIDIGFGAAKFTKVSIYHLLCTVKFACFISLSTKGYKINKIIKLLTKINSTESYTRDMNLKILPEPRYVLNMFQKNDQALFVPEKLIMHLTLHELAY
jgi:hypothetical protein